MVQPPIDFGAKSDRELLLLVAQTTNVIVQEHLPAIRDKLDELNGTVREHSIEIAKVKTKARCGTGRWGDRMVIIGGGVSGVVALLVAIAFGIGKGIGWW